MVPALTHCLFNLLGYHANACKNHGSTCINRTTANEWLADWLSCGRNYGPRRFPSHQCHFILTVTAMRGCMHGWMSCTTPCTHIVGGGSLYESVRIRCIIVINAAFSHGICRESDISGPCRRNIRTRRVAAGSFIAQVIAPFMYSRMSRIKNSMKRLYNKKANYQKI